MPPRYRNLVLALFGCLALANAAGSARPAEPARHAAHQAVCEVERQGGGDDRAGPGGGVPDPRAVERGRDAERRDREALAAAQLAAQAADRQASLALPALIVSAVGTLLVVVALAFSWDGNRIARTTSKQELRAYLGVIGVVAAYGDDGVAISFEIRNFGSTPASHAGSWTELNGRFVQTMTTIFNYGIIDPSSSGFGRVELIQKPGIERNIFNELILSFDITYQDVFGRRWRREIAFEIAGHAGFSGRHELTVVGGSSKEIELDSKD